MSGGGRRTIKAGARRRRRQDRARGRAGYAGGRLRDAGTLLIIFVFVAAMVSLALGVMVPLSVSANRWLVAVLALGCVLSRL